MQIAIGMRAMVLMNIATEADVANGTQGVIQDIVLDSQEILPEKPDCQMEMTLKYPPAVIIFKLDNPSEEYNFPGLAKVLVPIVPNEGSFTIQTRDGSMSRIHRCQLAIVAAYAFTHHKCQGQTMEYIIVDLGKPPSGTLDPFNAYIALSRSHGRVTIRLLRRGADNLYTVHPSMNELKKEDERLYILVEMTAKSYEDGLYKW